MPSYIKTKSKYKIIRNRKQNFRKTQVLESVGNTFSLQNFLAKIFTDWIIKNQKVYQPLENKMQSSYSIEAACNEKSPTHGPKLEEYFT